MLLETLALAVYADCMTALVKEFLALLLATLLVQARRSDSFIYMREARKKQPARDRGRVDNVFRVGDLVLHRTNELFEAVEIGSSSNGGMPGLA